GAGARVGCDGRADVERLVGEMAAVRLTGAVGLLRRRGEVHIVLEQACIRGGAVLFDLERVRGGRVRPPIHAWPAAIKVVEAVVLLVDHNDVVDSVEAFRVGGRLDAPDPWSGGDDRGES